MMTRLSLPTRAAAKILRMKSPFGLILRKSPPNKGAGHYHYDMKLSIAVAILSTKSNMALILRHPLSAMAVRSLRPPSSNRNIFLNQSMLQSGKGVGRLFSSNGSVQITYIDQGGKEHSVNADIGKSLMDIAHDNNIELEGKCSIQHNIFSIFI